MDWGKGRGGNQCDLPQALYILKSAQYFVLFSFENHDSLEVGDREILRKGRVEKCS